jgi:hypothetical protein
MTTDTIHTCSYYCERPECVRRQRDELRDRLESALAQRPPSAPVGVEEMQRRLDREESDHGRTIDQRDAAEDALGRMFQAVTGRVAEWSSAWGYTDAIEEVEEHVAALARQPAAVDGLAARLVDELDGLVGESYGVSGLHLNGDVAPWDELLPGGRFERLSSLDELRAALAAQQQGGAE